MRRITLTSKEDRVTDNALITCLWFDTEGEAAATYYTSIFKDSKPRQGEPLRRSRATSGWHGHGGRVRLNGQRFVALNGGPEFKFNEAISIQIMCADQDEVDCYWDRPLKVRQEVAWPG